MSLRSDSRRASNPFDLSKYLASVPGKWLRYMIGSWIESLLGLKELSKRYSCLPASGSAGQFVRNSFQSLNIKYVIEAGDISDIPKTGPTVVVANHPFGAVEGMLLMDLMSAYRDDVRVMANSLLTRIPDLQSIILGVDPYEHKGAKHANMSAMRKAKRWLMQGGLLIVFPAGDVASLRWGQLSTNEGRWNSSIARLARLCDASVVPVHFSGRNSTLFCVVGSIHPVLKTIFLPRELLNKSNTTLRVRIGKAFDRKRLLTFDHMQDMADYMRLRTCWLGEEDVVNEKHKQTTFLQSKVHIIDAQSPDLLCNDIATLPQEQCLAKSGELKAWYATADQIPHVLQEIGRQREISFRSAGEGTGRSIDLDIYDRFYLHLFVWDENQNRVVGGYRLGLVDEILRKYGKRGLYSYSLFHYSRTLLQEINPAIELGRSFVSPDYQRNFAPLMLLWKGIGSFVAMNPRYANLFGPVSISNEYNSMSQLLLIRFLKQNLSDFGLSRHVKPRNPYRMHKNQGLFVREKDMTLEEISLLIEDIEEDDKGVPVLIRQYLKMGGKMLGFNVDSNFGNCVDGLIRVDLRQVEPRVLSKYLGSEGARNFRAVHSRELQQAG